MKRIIATGQLHPSDEKPTGVQGCTFTVWYNNGWFDVEIRSPYSNREVVESAERLTSKEVFVWLGDRSDY